jgi:lysophospholipase L1-like esterase
MNPQSSGYRWSHIVRDIGIFFVPIILVEVVAWYGWHENNWVRMDARLGFDADHSMLVLDEENGAEIVRINPDMWGCGASRETWRKDAGGDTMRIVVVGGSSARGLLEAAGTELVETSFARRLEEILPPLVSRPVEVINLGVPGFGSSRIRFMARDAWIFRPDLVIAYVGDNEFIESRIRSSYIDETSLRARLRWIVLGTWSGRVFLRVLRADESSLERDRELRSGRDLVRSDSNVVEDAAHVTRHFEAEEEDVLGGATARFRELARDCRKEGVPLVLIPAVPNILDPPRRPGLDAMKYWNDARSHLDAGDSAAAVELFRESLDRDGWGLRANTRMRRAIVSLGDSASVLALDPWDSFHEATVRGRRLFTDYNHLSDEGHDHLASMIADSVVPLLRVRR